MALRLAEIKLKFACGKPLAYAIFQKHIYNFKEG
jgi:hypothetical protein